MLKAQVPADASAPVFGAWVKVAQGDTTIYGVVSMVEQGSVMPNRQPIALGKTTEELVREMPHVLELLRTSFTAVIIAYKDDRGVIRQSLPPDPAAMHGFVEACDPEEIKSIGPPFDFLRTLVNSSDAAVFTDDLLIATLKTLMQAHEPEGYATLVQAGRTLSRLLRDDHERLQAILRRVK
jgi:hypothetical protein